MPYILGLLIGSFLNVCIYRIPKEESIITSPSHCTFCGNRIKWYDLIPLFSYLRLRGRCPSCKHIISIKYPIIEFTNMVAYGVIFYLFGYSVDMVFGCILFSTLLVISIIDVEHYIIPDGMNVFLLILGVVYSIIKNQFLYGFSGFVAGLVPLLLIYFITSGKMGGGDIKLLAAAGWFLGWKNVLLSLFGASIIGSILSLILIAIRIRSREDRIPFGPYLSLGIVITFFYGDKILRWYLNLLI